jgi:hypothetical protein
MGDVCEQCEKEYQVIAQHWLQSSDCQHPPLSQHQREIATGVLMGDGTVNRGSKNLRLQSEMISRNYLQYIDNQFGVFGNGVSLYQTAAESAKECRDRGFSPDADADDYSNLYRWQSMRHPDFNEFGEWYDSGEKMWPDNIKLTPIVLKHWYCGDGYYDKSGSHNRITIAMANEVDNTDKVDAMFQSVGLPMPNNYSIQERSNGSVDCNAVWTVEQSRKLWNYMGDPLPDFSYKWPEDFK